MSAVPLSRHKVPLALLSVILCLAPVSVSGAQACGRIKDGHPCSGGPGWLCSKSRCTIGPVAFTTSPWLSTSASTARTRTVQLLIARRRREPRSHQSCRNKSDVETTSDPCPDILKRPSLVARQIGRENGPGLARPRVLGSRALISSIRNLWSCSFQPSVSNRAHETRDF